MGTEQACFPQYRNALPDSSYSLKPTERNDRLAASKDGQPVTADRPQWADRRKLAQVAFRPEWGKHGRSAPFKRNDAMLDLLVFPCTGIQENLADKARKLGIPVMKHEGDA
jgi:hypothetical protein